MNTSQLLIVAAGGAIGAAARHVVGGLALRHLGAGFPFGTLTVNAFGCFVMGMLIALFARYGSGMAGGSGLRLFLATGVLGGFTTFSAFSLEVVLLWQRGAASLAAIYIGLSIAATIAALLCGLALVRAIV